MSLLLVGELRDVRVRRAGNDEVSWDETVVYVLSGIAVERVSVASGKNFTFRGEVPTREDVGNVVALEIGVSTYAHKLTGEARYQMTAFGRAEALESALAAAPAALKAVS